eukprot:TRINITY_DN4430_c0_g1_i1.p1 TRINITY_DN4430_c0_g1~~TRINITY_DN4430_c0_g1_i1.p1  ORF type:complete len:944 (-),score=283.55 TRINITY_DN4430_c0_g1_i1:235-3066(-)
MMEEQKQPHIDVEDVEDAASRERSEIYDKLLKIFEFYTVLGDQRLSSVTISALNRRQFVQLLKDANIFDNLFIAPDADIIFTDFTTKRKQKMEFPVFLEAVEVVALRKFDKMSHEEAVRVLLDEHIFLHCRTRETTDITPELLSEEVLEILRRYKVSLQQLFSYYSILEDPSVSQESGPTWEDFEYANQTMSFTEFFRLLQDFNIAPKLVSGHDAVEFFRIVNESEIADDDKEVLNYSEFTELLGMCALEASKRDSSMTPAEKVDWFINYMFSDESFAKIRSLYFDRNPANLSKAMKSQVLQSIRTHRKTAIDVESREKPILDEILEEYEDQLKSVFQFYATVGVISTSDIHSVGVRQFFQLVRDSKILTSKFSLAHVELLFVEVTKSGEKQARMNYEGFKQALKLLASRLSSKTEPSETLRSLIMEKILVFARRRAKSDPMDEALTDIEVVNVIREYRQSFLNIFNYYANRDQKDASFDDAKVQDETIEFSELMLFAQDFELVPSLLTKRELVEAFRSANEGVSSDDDDQVLTFSEFEEVIVRIAVAAFSKPERKLDSHAEKVQALVRAMVQSDKISRIGRFTSERDGRLLMEGIASQTLKFVKQEHEAKRQKDQRAADEAGTFLSPSGPPSSSTPSGGRPRSRSRHRSLRKPEGGDSVISPRHSTSPHMASPGPRSFSTPKSVATSSAKPRQKMIMDDEDLYTPKKYSELQESRRRTPRLVVSLEEVVNLVDLCSALRAGIKQHFTELRSTIDMKEATLLSQVEHIEQSLGKSAHDAAKRGRGGVKEHRPNLPTMEESKAQTLQDMRLSPPGKMSASRLPKDDHKEEESDEKGAMKAEEIDSSASLPEHMEGVAARCLATGRIRRELELLSLHPEVVKRIEHLSPSVASMAHALIKAERSRDPLAKAHNVYERLYQKAQEKKMTEKTTPRSPKPFSMYSDM